METSIKRDTADEVRAPRRMFSALSHRNYLLFWAGASLSNMGSWMQMVAQGWLVLELTDSPFWLGVDGFIGAAPGLLLTLLGGVVADLVDRKRLLILTQVISGLSALALAISMLLGVVDNASDIWIVLFLSGVTGCCFAVAGPSFQAITFDLVGREDIANAVALNSAQFQLARVVGPLLAAVTIKLFGLVGCFIANAISYGAIVIGLSLVKFEEKREVSLSKVAASGDVEVSDAPAKHSLRNVGALWSDLVDGLRYVATRPRVRLLVVCTAVVSLFGTPYLSLMPVFARNIYGWEETGLSLMMATAGAGALSGALLIAYLGDFRRKGRLVMWAAVLAGLCLIGFALAPGGGAALPVLYGAGFTVVCHFAVTNTLLQQLVTDRMRGRVMSIWILGFIGTMPFGNLIGGIVAERYGPRLTVMTGGLVISTFVALVGLRNTKLLETQ